MRGQVRGARPWRREAQAVQWADLRKANPYGFDIVVEATGVERLAQESLNWVRRGGTLMIYGVYSDEARVSWPPSKIFGDEIRVSFFFRQALRIRILIVFYRLLGPSPKRTAFPARLRTWTAAK